MEQNEFLTLPELRQLIHDMTLQKRATGLSPPEEQLLDRLEMNEAAKAVFLLLFSKN